MKTFEELGLSKEILRVIEEIHFKEPTEIQEKALPLALAGKDVIGESATGSGKTLAFGAPIIQKIIPNKELQALILTPTRELAEQVAKSISAFAKYSKINVAAVYGGVSFEPQVEKMSRSEIVVGTPGRILDHINQRTINLSKIKFLVLDEADRMLDMGFIHDVTDIIDRCPKERQTFLFSATISEEILRISKHYMSHAVVISAENQVDPSKLEQVFYDVPGKEKFSLLVHLLKEEHSKLIMVFCNTKHNTDFIGRNLERQGFNTLTLHGDLNQNKRNKILEILRRSDKAILVCTDVAARGLDIKNVSHVYNYDCPKTSTEYIHRIGRTARAGKEGKAVTILSEKDYENFRRVSSDPSLKIQHIPLPEFPRVFIRVEDDRRRGRDRGRERSGGNFRPQKFSGRGGASRGGSDRGRRRFGGGGRSFGERGSRSDGKADRRNRSRFGERRSFGEGRRSFSRGRSFGNSRFKRR